MIDLHCHLLPQIDDGSKSLAESLEMARIAVADGITVAACTPHIAPGLFDNTGTQIRSAVAQLQSALKKADIQLTLVSGADVHMSPGLLGELRAGRALPLGNSRYFLLELPSAVIPPRIEDYVFSFVSAGYAPIITHPERLPWIESHYAKLERLVQLGAWIQVTGGSLLGQFGRGARYWAERLLEEGLAQLLASDAHNTKERPPCLAGAVEAAARIVGETESLRLVVARPVGILRNVNPSEISLPAPNGSTRDRETFWRRAAKRARI